MQSVFDPDNGPSDKPAPQAHIAAKLPPSSYWAIGAAAVGTFLTIGGLGILVGIISSCSWAPFWLVILFTLLLFLSPVIVGFCVWVRVQTKLDESQHTV